MAHNIEQFDNVYTVGDKAWHGLDYNVQVGSLDEVKEKVFNWEPLELPLTYSNPLTQELEMSDHKAIYRIVNDQFLKLGEVGRNYTIVSNKNTVEHVKPIFETGLVSLETAGTLFNGRKTWIMGKLTEYEPIPGDKRIGYIAFFNSHDGSTTAGWVCTETRIVCDNTRRLAMNSTASKILSTKHTVNVIQNLELIRDALYLVNSGFIETQEKLKELAKVVIQSEDQIKKIVKVAFSLESLEDAVKTAEMSDRKPRTLDDIVHLFEHGKGQDLPGIKGTGLALHEAFTEYLNHKAGLERQKPTSQDARLDSVLFGQGRKVIERADQAILALR